MKKKDKKNPKKLKFRSVILFSVFSVIVIGFTSYTTFTSWVEIYDKYKENKNLSVKLKKLKKKEAALQADINKMQDSEYIARYAREKYLYSKDGEFILNIK